MRFRSPTLRLVFPSLPVISMILSLAPAAAATLVFDRSQTLDGWHERTFTSSWADLDPDVKNLVSTDANGDLRGFGHSSLTVWLQSPGFVLLPGASISIASLYLMAGTAAAPLSDADISATKTGDGWAGVALRDSEGNFLLTHAAATIWAPVSFSATELEPYVGETLTLDFISANNSSGDFLYVNRPITIDGALASVPEPSVLLLSGASAAGLFRRRRRDS